MDIKIEILIWIAVVVFSYLSAKGVSFLLGILKKKFAAKTKSMLDDYIVEALRKKPVTHIFVLIALLWIANDAATNFPLGNDRIIFYLMKILIIYGIMIGAFIIDGIASAILKWSNEELIHRDKVSLLGEFFPLLKRIVRTAVFSLTALVILSFLGIDVSALIVSMGVAGAAIALAVKNTIENAVSGLLIMLDRPFRVGDRVKLSSGEVGDIFEIGLRSTKILTFDNNLVILPNSKLLDDKLTNLSYPEPIMRVIVDVGVSYGSDIERVKSIMESVAQNHPSVLSNPVPKAYFIKFNDSSLDFTLRGMVEKYTDAWDTENQLREMIYKAFAENNIEIPFPQVDINMREENGNSG